MSESRKSMYDRRRDDFSRAARLSLLLETDWSTSGKFLNNTSMSTMAPTNTTPSATVLMGGGGGGEAAEEEAEAE